MKQTFRMTATQLNKEDTKDSGKEGSKFGNRRPDGISTNHHEKHHKIRKNRRMRKGQQPCENPETVLDRFCGQKPEEILYLKAHFYKGHHKGSIPYNQDNRMRADTYNSGYAAAATQPSEECQ